MLLSSGWTIDQVLELSWPQIELSARCIYRHQMNMINSVMEPIAASFGSKEAQKSVAKKSKQQKNLTPEQKDSLRLQKLKQLGFEV